MRGVAYAPAAEARPLAHEGAAAVFPVSSSWTARLAREVPESAGGGLLVVGTVALWGALHVRRLGGAVRAAARRALPA